MILERTLRWTPESRNGAGFFGAGVYIVIFLEILGAGGAFVKLQEALDQLNLYGDDDVIFSRKPWALDAEALVGTLDSELKVPDSLKGLGWEYFLEVSVAKEVLEAFGNRKPSVQEARDLLLFYAENDAYPDWIYRGNQR